MAFATWKDAVDRFRRYVGDIPQLNTLDKEIENTDDEITDYIKDAMIEINSNYEPRTGWSLAEIIVEPNDPGQIAWSTVKLGALLQMLTSKGVLSARNAITYSDAGGVTVSEMDKWGRYINYFNTLANKYERSVLQAKMRFNIQQAYGGTASPMGYDYYYG